MHRHRKLATHSSHSLDADVSVIGLGLGTKPRWNIWPERGGDGHSPVIPVRRTSPCAVSPIWILAIASRWRVNVQRVISRSHFPISFLLNIRYIQLHPTLLRSVAHRHPRLMLSRAAQGDYTDLSGKEHLVEGTLGEGGK